MSTQHWTLLGAQQHNDLNEQTILASDVAGCDAPFQVRQRRLRGGRCDGVDLIEIENDALRLIVVPTRGMGIWKVFHKSVELGWRSPVTGPVHPSFVRLEDPSGIGWLDGFDEWLVRCGLHSNGAPEWSPDGKLVHALHGRIANSPAHQVELTIDPDRAVMELTGVVDEARLFGPQLRLTSTLTLPLSGSTFSVRDEVQNLAATPGEMQLLYHINFGLPWHGPGATLLAPIATLAPKDAHAAAGIDQWMHYPAPTPGVPESVYFFELAADADQQTAVMLRAADQQTAVTLSFNRKQLPYFAQWKNPIAASDGYVTGLEPCVNFPNGKSYERSQGRVIALQPGETRTFALNFEIHADPASVQAGEQAIAALQQSTSPHVHRSPKPGWSPSADSSVSAPL